MSDVTKAWLHGRAEAYCEMVKRGVRLAGCLNCDVSEKDALLKHIAEEGCLSIVFDGEHSRATVYIYKNQRAGVLIHELQKSESESPTFVEIWATGKLFGYSDAEVLEFLWKGPKQ